MFRLRGYQITAQQLDWLLETQSLTHKLAVQFNQRPRVEVLKQQFEPLGALDASSVGAPPRTLALIRDVQLSVCEQPCFSARTIIPVSSLKGRLRHLRYWGARSIGTLIFGTPCMRRTAPQLARLTGRGHVTTYTSRTLAAQMAPTPDIEGWAVAQSTTCTISP